MVDLEKLTAADFEARLNETFDLVVSDGSLPLRLTEIRPLGAAYAEHQRAPFALVFQTRGGLRVPQGVYRLQNAALAGLELFLVQVAGDRDSSTLEAVFT